MFSNDEFSEIEVSECSNTEIKVVYKTSSPIPIKKRAKKLIAHGRRVNAYNKVEETQAKMRSALTNTKRNLRLKTALFSKYKTFAYTGLSCTSENLTTKLSIQRLIQKTEPSFLKMMRAYRAIDKSSQCLNTAHLLLYRSEDYYVAFEENLVRFFKASRLMNRDLIRLNTALSQLDFINELDDIIDWDKIESNDEILDRDALLTLAMIQQIVFYFELAQIYHPIMIPGQSDFPLEFNSDMLVFESRRES